MSCNSVSLLAVYVKEVESACLMDTCIHMFIEVLLPRGRLWYCCRFPSVSEWMKKVWYVCKMEYYSAMHRAESCVWVKG